jgi:imidazole glycerol-phosphate synthase subunit HisH
LSELIAIIDYNMCNLRSVEKSFRKFNCETITTNDSKIISKADKIILPGVGSFKDGMKELQKLDLLNTLDESVIRDKKPFLGICLGMQLIAKTGHENGVTEGIGWIDADVIRFNLNDNQKNIKVPHVGWNSVRYKKNCLLYSDIPDNSDFYFVHSYHYKVHEDVTTGETDHGEVFTSSIQKNNIFGFQFHPEKSQSAGLKIISNFINL